MFVDMFWYTVLSYFVLYTPTTYFSGRKIWIFRSFSIIPVIVLFVGTVMRALNKVNIEIPGFLLPLLPCQPVTFLISFCSLLCYLKVKEHRYINAGHTLEEYNQYRLSSHGVYLFSRFTSLSFFIASVVDLIFSIIILTVDVSDKFKSIAVNFGVGKGSVLFFGIPFIMLFNYAKPSGSLMSSILIPTIGTAVIVILYLEAIYIAIRITAPMLLKDKIPFRFHGSEEEEEEDTLLSEEVPFSL